MTMLVPNEISIVMFWIFVVRNTSHATCHDEELCRIRFYERKYFKGNYWTLDEKGKWNSSRHSPLKFPYRHFQTKSIRLFCSNSCKWQICPVRTRKNARIPRRKKCKILTGVKSLSSLRLWGWPNYILGRVYRLANQSTGVKPFQGVTYAATTHLPESTTPSSEILDGKSTSLNTSNDNEIHAEQTTTTNLQTTNWVLEDLTECSQINNDVDAVPPLKISKNNVSMAQSENSTVIPIHGPTTTVGVSVIQYNNYTQTTKETIFLPNETVNTSDSASTVNSSLLMHRILDEQNNDPFNITKKIHTGDNIRKNINSTESPDQTDIEISNIKERPTFPAISSTSSPIFVKPNNSEETTTADTFQFNNSVIISDTILLANLSTIRPFVPKQNEKLLSEDNDNNILTNIETTDSNLDGLNRLDENIGEDSELSSTTFPKTSDSRNKSMRAISHTNNPTDDNPKRGKMKVSRALSKNISVPLKQATQTNDTAYEDDQICALAAINPRNYLLPHPFDCTKFYICQNLGSKTRWRGGWKAHVMKCPPKTGFSIKLMICNWMSSLPRCSRG